MRRTVIEIYLKVTKTKRNERKICCGFLFVDRINFVFTAISFNRHDK